MDESTLDLLAAVFGESDPQLKAKYNEYKNLRDNFDEIVKRETKELIDKINNTL